LQVTAVVASFGFREESRYPIDFVLRPTTPVRADRAHFLAFKEIVAGPDAVDENRLTGPDKRGSPRGIRDPIANQR
jgi:hypothetical protein